MRHHQQDSGEQTRRHNSFQVKHCKCQEIVSKSVKLTSETHAAFLKSNNRNNVLASEKNLLFVSAT